MKTLLWQSAALALLAALSLVSRVDWQKNQPQQNGKKLAATANLKWKTNTAGWHDAEKDSKTPSLPNQVGKPETPPANQAFTHGAILFVFSQPPLSHNTARSYFLWNIVEEKITE